MVSGTQTLTLLPAGEGGVAVKLGMMDSKRSEYFLAEVRGPAAGVDTGIKDARGNPNWGLALYHVEWSRGPRRRPASGPAGSWVNADHSVTATFTAPAVADACSDVTCGPMEQCQPSGARARQLCCCGH